ncbi:DUF4282 domain-containing protein [Jannaschia sp. R86511]|uniref:DUF4282 domain-containing protein n=1 Tax=Jannaschia sp. R86511 TaxID=3093853 RepID=UPI0036D393C6
MPTKGFFASLFDLSFDSLITTKIVKVVYVLVLVLIALGYLVFLVSSFVRDPAVGVAVLVLGIPVAFFYVIVARIQLEIVIAVFRIMESNVEIAAQGRGRAAPPAPPVAGPDPAY